MAISLSNQDRSTSQVVPVKKSKSSKTLVDYTITSRGQDRDQWAISTSNKVVGFLKFDVERGIIFANQKMDISQQDLFFTKLLDIHTYSLPTANNSHLTGSVKLSIGIRYMELCGVDFSTVGLNHSASIKPGTSETWLQAFQDIDAKCGGLPSSVFTEFVEYMTSKGITIAIPVTSQDVDPVLETIQQEEPLTNEQIDQALNSIPQPNEEKSLVEQSQEVVNGLIAQPKNKGKQKVTQPVKA